MGVNPDEFACKTSFLNELLVNAGFETSPNKTYE